MPPCEKVQGFKYRLTLDAIVFICGGTCIERSPRWPSSRLYRSKTSRASSTGRDGGSGKYRMAPKRPPDYGAHFEEGESASKSPLLDLLSYHIDGVERLVGLNFAKWAIERKNTSWKDFRRH